MAFDIYKNSKDEQKQLNALKVMLSANESMVNFLQLGPGVMSVKSLEQGSRELQGSQGQQQDKNDVINNR